MTEKIDYNRKIKQIENKVPDTPGLVNKTDYNKKVTDIENKILVTTNFFLKLTVIQKFKKLKRKTDKSEFHAKLIETSYRVTSNKRNM